MNIESLISAYGYPALALGTILEGGTVGMIAGGLAHRGYLQLEWVIAIIFCCAFSADQFFFQLGKRGGKGFLEKRPGLDKRVDTVRRFLVVYQVIAVLGFRFIYGMRTITPIIIGASGFDTRRFVLLNLCSTLAWATVVGTVGYFFSHLFEMIFADVKQHIAAFVFLFLLFGGTVWIVRRWIKGRF
jgi:membrane protein DedA with SNARE-associated domain